MLHLRKATDADAEAIHELRVTFLEVTCRGFLGDDVIRRYVRYQRVDTCRAMLDDGPAVIAEWDGTTVGYGHLLPTGQDDAAEILVVVAPDSLSRGIGAAILDWVVERAREQGLRTLLVSADPQRRRFFERHGFAGDGESWIAKRRQLLMCRPLD